MIGDELGRERSHACCGFHGPAKASAFLLGAASGFTPTDGLSSALSSISAIAQGVGEGRFALRARRSPPHDKSPDLQESVNGLTKAPLAR